MKTARASLAIAAGTLLALGYAAGTDRDPLTPQRIIIGLMFGAFMAFTMICRPEHASRKVVLFLVAPLLLALVIHEILTGTRAEAIVTIAISIAFLAIQIAYVSLPLDTPRQAAPEKS